MKKNTKTDPAASPTALRSILSVAAIIAAAIPAAAAQAESQTEQKTHTLFMGADISVEQNKVLYRVQDVSGESWVIAVKGAPVTVSAKDGPISLKIERSLKITEVSAFVGKLKGEPSYTPGRDPGAQYARQTAASENLYIGSQMQLSNAVIRNAQETAVVGDYNLGKVANPSLASPSSDAAAAALAQDAVQTLTAAANGPGTTTDLAPGQNGPGGFDAMEVTFDVSSERPLNSPYVVIITQFHDPNGRPGTVRNLVYAQALNPIGPQSKRIDVLEGGFPPGFELKNYQLHLYDHGVEVATNVAPKRVALTRDEAFEYVKMEYVGAHKDATLPPVPAMGRLPADLPSRLSGGQFGETLYIKVSKDGLAGEAFLDAACSQKVGDPYLKSVVKDIRFKPALENGKPVDGVAPVKLGQLMM
jgi:hypothetical protein